MKQFTFDGSTSFDIVHIRGEESKYRKYLNNGKIILESIDANRQYVTDLSTEELIFRNENIISSTKISSEFKTLANSCKALREFGYDTDGIYTIYPESGVEFDVYCDMTTDGGGWTLVWSHLIDTDNYPAVSLKWTDAINTTPRVSTSLSADKLSFEVYTGLKFWKSITKYNPNPQMYYEWALSGKTLDQSAIIDGTLDENNNWALNLTNSRNVVGSVVPGIYSYHNNRPFTTTDVDNDASSGNCANSYQETPWWYGKCWSGSINGGGTQDYLNAAFWYGSSTTSNGANGTGGGNGWLYIR